MFQGDSIRDVPSAAMNKGSKDVKVRDDLIIENSLNNLAESMDQFNWRDDAFMKIKDLLESEDVHVRGRGCQQMKEVLSASRDEIAVIASSAIESGIIPLLCNFLDDPHAPPANMITACFCLTNVLAGTYEQTSMVVDCGIVPPLLKLLVCNDPKMRRQAMFAIANIAGNTDRERKMLADNPLYWQNMKQALVYAPKQIEELGSWNLRNTCVLGGPPLDQMQIAVTYFMDLLKREVCLFDYGAGYTALRFGMETLASVAKSAEGRKALLTPQYQTPAHLLICARFCNDQLAREYCLETLWRLLEYPENHGQGNEECLDKLIQHQIDHMVQHNALYVLNGIMKRTSIYSEEHRMYCCRVAMLLVLRSSNPLLLSCLCLNRSSLERERTNTTEMNLAMGNHQYADALLEEAKASMVTGMELHYLKEQGPNAAPSEDEARNPMPFMGEHGRNAPRGGGKYASLFETLFKIVYQLDFKYEQWTREAAGRALLAIMANVPPELLQKLVHPTVINGVVEISEQCQICELWMKEQLIVTEFEELNGPTKPKQPVEGQNEAVPVINHLTLQKLTYPEGVKLAVLTLNRLLDLEGSNGFVRDMFDDPDLKLLSRLRKLMFNTADYPQYAQYFNKENW